VAFASVASFYDATEAKSSMLSKPGTSYREVRLSMFHPQVLTSLDQLLFKFKILFTFYTKISYFNEEVNCTEPPRSGSAP